MEGMVAKATTKIVLWGDSIGTSRIFHSDTAVRSGSLRLSPTQAFCLLSQAHPVDFECLELIFQVTFSSSLVAVIQNTRNSLERRQSEVHRQVSGQCLSTEAGRSERVAARAGLLE